LIGSASWALYFLSRFVPSLSYGFNGPDSA
jgi:hypothetical protein